MRANAVVLFLFLLSGLGVMACGQPVAPCGPSTCSGCCDSTGSCQGGTSLIACGQFGNQCTPCGASQTCSLGVCLTQSSCTPTTCAAAGKNCGSIPDGCGRTLDCGTCANGQSCGAGGANVCGTGTCTPQTCTGLGAQCGSVSDGCSLQLQCGTCSGGSSCDTMNHCSACVPATCAALGKNCGSVPDGCGAMLPCGTCNSPDVCGGGGTANVCGQGSCVPTTCAALGKNCGSVPDGCGAMLPCGTCTGTQTCGGAGTANVCGATCLSSCPMGFTCDAMGTCSGGPLSGLVLNEIGVAVSGAIRVNGQAPTFSMPTYCSTSGNLTDAVAQVRFTEATRGYSALAYVRCNTNSTFTTTLPPGTYEVRVEASTYSAQSGINLLPVSYLADPALVVTAATNGLVLNEVGHAVSGTLQVNGAAPSFSMPTYCTTSGNLTDSVAQVRFIEASKGYSALAFVRCNSGSTFSTLLPPGAYEVRVEASTYSTQSGINLLPVSYVALPSLTISAPVSGLVLNEVGFAASGSIQINGAAPSYSMPTYCSTSGNLTDAVAQIRFTDASKGYSALAFVRCNTNFTFSTLLPAGTYDVRVEASTYTAQSGINLMPLSYQARTALVVNAAVTNLTLNEVGVAFAGVIQVNGAAPTFSMPTYCTTSGNLTDAIAQIHMRELTKGYDAFLFVRCNSNFTFSTTALPLGTWEVRVEASTYSNQSGINLIPFSYLAAPALVVSAPMTGLVLNEVGHTVSGTIRINGQAPTFSMPTYCTTSGNLTDAIAQLRFTDATKGYSGLAYVRCNQNFAFTTQLPPGTYEVRLEASTYSAQSGINLMPVSYVVNPALVVSAPQSGVVFNETGVTVSGVIRVNGAAPTFSMPTYCTTSGNLTDAIAQVHFREATFGYDALAFVRCNSSFAFSTLLPVGTYEVRVEPSTYSVQSGINLMPLSYQAVTLLRVQ